MTAGILAAIHAERAAAAEVFFTVGATSPARARPQAELGPAILPHLWNKLVAEGAIREAAPGTFYWYDHPASRRVSGWKILLIALVNILIITLAVVYRITQPGR